MRNVYRIATRKRIRDLSGTGSALYGGRWNPKGFYVLYTADSASLAMLEWLAHARDRDMDEPYFLATLLIPEQPIYKPDLHTLPEYWKETPPLSTVQEYGARQLSDEKWLAIEMPSVIMPLDSNIILHVRHPLFAKVEIVSIEPLLKDARLIEKKS
jgi:RES domain-containing protein